MRLIAIHTSSGEVLLVTIGQWYAVHNNIINSVY